jgi:hypothetical protein
MTEFAEADARLGAMHGYEPQVDVPLTCVCTRGGNPDAYAPEAMVCPVHDEPGKVVCDGKVTRMPDGKWYTREWRLDSQRRRCMTFIEQPDA